MSATHLVADLAKKSGLVFVAYGGRSYAVWHEWVTDAVCVVSGGGEQRLPGITDQSSVRLLLRSKTTRALAAEAEARVERIEPGSEHWDAVTSALRGGRLNLTDSAHAIERWARESVVVRLVPTGTVVIASKLDDTLQTTAPPLSG